MGNDQYKKSHINFIMNLKKKGKTYSEISDAFGKKFGFAKSPQAVRSVFRRNEEFYDLDGMKSQAEVRSEVMQERMLRDLADYAKKNKFVPTQKQYINETGYSNKQIEAYFGSYQNLEDIARKEISEAFEPILDESAFGPEESKKLQNVKRKYRRFVVTSAVTGCEPHEKGLAALRSYCEHNNAQLLILPCSDPAHTRAHKYDFSLDHRLPKESIVFEDVNLNSNVFLSTIKLSAKHINPLTGLSRIGQRKGSFIYASPKQSLEYVAVSNKKDIPRALMTTGAITIADYQTKLYMSDRTAHIAENDHVLGAIIVEVEDDHIFYFRQIQIEPDTGSFCDIDRQYLANGKVRKIKASLVQLPDYHVGSTDPIAKACFKDVVKTVSPTYITLEDFFDGISINHHEIRKAITQAKKANHNLLSLEQELKACRDQINELSTWNAKELVFKYGNHEDFLYRWLQDMDFTPQNLYVGVTLVKATLEGHAPFEYAMRELYPIDSKVNARFLGINDSFVVNGVENAVHGHLGASGTRNPGLASLEKSYGKVNTGHTHSAAILRNVFRVGTLTHLQLGYNDGPSAWTQTLLIQHENGSRQLINNIFGKWRLTSNK